MRQDKNRRAAPLEVLVFIGPLTAMVKTIGDSIQHGQVAESTAGIAVIGLTVGVLFLIWSLRR